MVLRKVLGEQRFFAMVSDGQVSAAWVVSVAWVIHTLSKFQFECIAVMLFAVDLGSGGGISHCVAVLLFAGDLVREGSISRI